MRLIGLSNTCVRDEKCPTKEAQHAPNLLSGNICKCSVRQLHVHLKIMEGGTQWMSDGACKLSVAEGGKQKRSQGKCALRQWLAIHAVSEPPESQRVKAQGL